MGNKKSIFIKLCTRCIILDFFHDGLINKYLIYFSVIILSASCPTMGNRLADNQHLTFFEY